MLTLGITSFLSQISLVAAMAAINNMLRKYGAMDAVFGQEQYAQIPMAVVGIVMKFFQIVISIVVGMAAGCIPIVGYNMGDYFKHWIEMGEMLGDKAPKIFNVNWFRVDEDGHFIWPGFGDNLRVLEWILKRCDNEVDAVETAIGYVPKPEDINLEGLKDFDEEKLASILKVDNAKWAKEAAGVEEFYKKFGDKLPQELRDELNGLEERTKA